MTRLLLLLVLGLGVFYTRPLAAAADSEAWPRALTLMAAGQADAALPLLEKLVSANPDNKNYRFELALALFALKSDFRARWHLEQLRGANLTPAERQLVEQVLAQIAARGIWSGSVNFAIKPETNAGQKTDLKTVNIGGFEFTLRPDARAKPGTSVLVEAGLGFSPPINDAWRWRFALNTHVRHNSDVALRDYQLIGRAGLQFLPDPRKSFAAGVQHGYRWIADQQYSRAIGLWAEHARLLGARGRLDVGIDLRNVRYTGPLPESRLALISASYSHAVSNRTLLTFSGYHEQSRGSLPNLVGARSGIIVTGLYAWRGGLMTSLQLGQHFDDRRGPEPLFGLTRRDAKTALSLTVYHRDLRLGSFAPTLIMGVEKNRSNIPTARYQNRYLTIGLTRNF